MELVTQLARSRASQEPRVLRKSVESAFAARWWAILSVAVQRIVAVTLTRDAGADLYDEEPVEQCNIIDLLDFNRLG